MAVDPTQADADELTKILSEHCAERCGCGHEISFGDIAWNNPATEAGTPFCIVEIICGNCDAKVARVSSWYPGVENTEELLSVLRDNEWE